MLTQLCGANRVLEIGTFTGYSALCFAEGGARTVTTLEIDPVAAAMAARYFALSGPLGAKIDLRLGLPALAQLAELRPEVPYDLVFLDADKRNVRAGGRGGGLQIIFFFLAVSFVLPSSCCLVINHRQTTHVKFLDLICLPIFLSFCFPLFLFSLFFLK